MKNNLKRLFPFAILFLSFLSCIKDTDFDNAEAITLTPIVDLNLIHFDIGAEEFYDETTATPILTVRDTTEIRFLDDPEIQESLLRAEFYYKFTNSIPRDFLVDFQFLSEANDTAYVFQAFVDQGTLNNPVQSEHIDNVEGEEIIQLTLASKLVVSVTLSSSDENLEGNLNLQSKTTYYLEF